MCARQMTGTSVAARSAGQHAGRLRVVEDHDVAGRSISASAAALAAQRRSYARAPPSPSGPPSPGAPCSRLCRRLVMRKNSAIALDDHPAAVDPGPAHVADQRAQHLRDAAAERRRVDVPDRVRAEQLVPRGDRLLEARQPSGGEHLGEALRVQRRDLDGLERHRARLLQGSPTMPRGQADRCLTRPRSPVASPPPVEWAAMADSADVGRDRIEIVPADDEAAARASEERSPPCPPCRTPR